MGRVASLAIIVLVAFGATACSAEFPPQEPLANVCSLLKGDEVATIAPGNDGGKAAGEETMPDFWVRSCDYTTPDFHYASLAVDGASDGDGGNILKEFFNAVGVDGTKESVDGVGDEAIFWDDGVETGVTAKAKGYLVTFTALLDPPPPKSALIPLTKKAIARLP